MCVGSQTINHGPLDASKICFKGLRKNFFEAVFCALHYFCAHNVDDWNDEDVEEAEDRQEILFKHSYLNSHILTEMDEFG